MTNKEALLSIFSYSQGADIVLINNSIDPLQDYTAEKQKDIEIAAADLMVYASSTPDITEGDNQITWTRENLIKNANIIYSKYGLTDKIVSDNNVTIRQDVW